MTKLMTYCFFFGILCLVNAQAQNSNFKWISLNEDTNFPTDEVYHIQEVEDGKIVMSTIGDGLVFLTDLEEITEYNQTNSGLGADTTFASLHDSQENLWIATFGKGLMKLDSNGEWVNYTTENSELPSNFISNVMEDANGNVWVSTLEFMSVLMDGVENGGLIKITPEGEWVHYSKENSPLSSNNTFSLLMDEEENLWIGTISAATPTELLDDGGGLCKLSPDGNWTVYNTENSGIGANNIMSLAKDEEGNIYAGSMDGFLSRLKPNGEWEVNRFVLEIPGYYGSTDLEGSILSMKYENNDLYIGFGPADLLCGPTIFDGGGLRGMFVFRNAIESFYTEPDDTNIGNPLQRAMMDEENLEAYTSGLTDIWMPFIQFAVTSFMLGEDGDLCIGTIGGGLYFFNKEGIVNLPNTDIWSGIMDGVESLESQLEMSIYPNPTSEYLQISLGGNLENKSLTLKMFSLEGKEVLTQVIPRNDQEVQLSFPDFIEGIYLLSLYEKQNLLGTTRLLIER